MFRRFQLIVFLLLAVALPIRGYASATMLFCAAAHDGHGAPQSAAHHFAGDDHQQHDHATTHVDAHQNDHSVDHAPPGSHEGDNDAKAVSSGSCSVCGVCCTGVAVGPTWPEVVALAVSTAVVPFIPSIYAGVDLDHAERPPLVFILA